MTYPQDLDTLERSERPAGPDDIVEAMALYGDQTIIRATTLDALIAELRASRKVVAAARALFGVIAPIEYDLGGNRLLIDLRAALAELEAGK